MSVVLCFEIAANTSVQLGKNVWASLGSSLRRYDTELSEFAALDDEEDFMRIEWADVNKNNYPQQYSYKGITYYSSTMSADAYNFFQQLGIPRYAKNVSVYYYQSPIRNALFGIEYVMNEEGTVVHNENALPLGFVAHKSILSFDLYAQSAGTATETALWLALTGEYLPNIPAQAEKLKGRGMTLTDFDTDRFSGTVTSEEDGVLLFTIAHDGGWRLFVDGEEVPLVKVAGYLSGAEISAGTHEIEMKYTVPGIIPGAVISGVGVIVLAVWIFIRKRKLYSV